MTVKEILEYWAKHVEYNPDQTHFNLLSSNFAFHECGKTMKTIMEEYDPTGFLSVMYAKLRYKEIMSQCKVDLWSIIEDPSSLDDCTYMWSIFNSAEISEAESKLIDSFNSKLSAIEGYPLIGEEDKEDSLKRIYDAIGDVCEKLNQCNIDVYLKGSNTVSLDKVCTYINIYDTLAECLVSLESKPDMVYVCYIRQYQSTGGYFAILIKSNGNILSVNDRVEEKYIGQHKNSRNGRWQESKRFELFPYNYVIESTKGEDYKGYALSYVVPKDPIPMKDLGADNYIHLLLAIILLSSKFQTYDIQSADIKYTNALFSNSVLLSSNDSESTDFIVVGNSMIARNHRDLHFQFTDEEIISGSPSPRFDSRSNPDNRDSGVFKNLNQNLVDLYGEGFHADSSVLAKYTKTKLISSGGEGILVYRPDGESEVIIDEFVGTEYKIEAQVYRGLRQQLANYIKSKMKTELESFGGVDAVRRWYEDLVIAKKDSLIDAAVQYYKEIVIDHTRSNYDYSPFCLSGSKDIQVSIQFSEHPSFGHTVMLNDPASKDSYGAYKYRCPITGNVANVWIWISPQTSDNIKSLFSESTLPKILDGWIIHDTLNGYNGNSILDNVDPVGELKHILTSNNCRFYLLIGLSKRGINKKLAELSKKN